MDQEKSGENLEALRSRLAALVRLHGQAGLARKGGTTRRNVHRYMGTVKPPVDFLARVTRSLGLSPSWMLLGTGPMYSGAAAGPDTGPRDLLTAIDVADATAALRLHTLSQLPSLASYREILQQLERAEGIRASREKQMVNALKDLFNKALSSAKFPSYDEALPILRVIERLLPLVNAPEVAVPTYTFLGTVLNNTLKEDEAIACWRKALLFSLFSGDKLNSQGFQSALGLAIAAMGKGETGRALHFTTALDVLDAHTGHAAPAKVRALNRMARSECLITTGRLTEGVAALQQALVDASRADEKVDARGFTAVAQLWSGLVSFDELAEQKVAEVHVATVLAAFSLFTEVESDLERAKAALAQAARAGYVLDERLVWFVAAVRKAVKSGKRRQAGSAAEIRVPGEDSATSPPDAFSCRAMRAALLRLHDEGGAVRAALDTHEYFMANCLAEHRYTLGAVMLHLRNLMVLLADRSQRGASADAREWARVELNRRYQAGFSVLPTVPGIREWITT